MSSVEVRGQAAECECRRPRFEIWGLFSRGCLVACNLQQAPFSLSKPMFLLENRDLNPRVVGPQGMKVCEVPKTEPDCGVSARAGFRHSV